MATARAVAGKDGDRDEAAKEADVERNSDQSEDSLGAQEESV